MKFKCGITAVCLALSLLNAPQKPIETPKPQVAQVIVVTIEKQVSLEEKIQEDKEKIQEDKEKKLEELKKKKEEEEKVKKAEEEKKSKAFGIVLQYSAPYNVTENKLTRSKGVNYYNGYRETWYSQKVLPGGGLKIPGRHVANDGTVRDQDGYIAISANRSDLAYGATVLTSLGPAKVYDTGVKSGTLDLYVAW